MHDATKQIHDSAEDSISYNSNMLELRYIHISYNSYKEEVESFKAITERVRACMNNQNLYRNRCIIRILDLFPIALLSWIYR